MSVFSGKETPPISSARLLNPTPSRHSIERVKHGDNVARRGTVLALTWLGGVESMTPVGEALRDSDRAVRLIAENGIQSVWARAGSIEQCHRLQTIMRWNRGSQFHEAATLAGEILEENPGFSEVWYQRAFSRYGLSDFDAAIADSQQALEANPYHFHAAVGLGQCYLEREDPATALCCFQWALQIHPCLEFARAQVRRLQRELRKRLDR